MRSVVVVLPASTCAMIPMFRVLAIGRARFVGEEDMAVFEKDRTPRGEKVGGEV
jgi:hypothetical protein